VEPVNISNPAKVAKLTLLYCNLKVKMKLLNAAELFE